MEAKVLSREDILSVKDITIEKVDVPEWGGSVYVRGLSAIQREKYVESLRKIEGHGRKATEKVILAQASAKLAQMTICDASGTLLFSAEDIVALGQKSAKALERVVNASAKLNGLDTDAEEDAKNALAATTEQSDASSTV